MPRIRRRTLQFFVPLALIAAFGVARMLLRPPVRYTIRGVGMDIPSGSAALDINNRGVIVGLEVPPPEPNALWNEQKRSLFVERDGTTEFLFRSRHEYQEVKINDRGDILAVWVEGVNGPSTAVDRSILWRHGDRIVLEFQGHSIRGLGLAPDGSVSGAFGIVPAIWKDGHTTILPPPDNHDPFGMALNINGRGDSVGWVGLNNDAPVMWRDGKAQNLPKPAKADVRTYPSAINSRGQVVGMYESTSGRKSGSKPISSHACLWENGTVRELGALWADSRAQDINDRGQIVGSSEVAGPLRINWNEWRTPGRLITIEGNPRAVLFEGEKAVDLNSVVPPRSGWVLKNAIAINDRGQIVGEGTYRGKPRGFVLTPVGPVQPAG